MYNNTVPVANPTQINDGIINHNPIIAVLLVFVGGILLTYHPCNKAIMIPITQNIQPCCIEV